MRGTTGVFGETKDDDPAEAKQLDRKRKAAQVLRSKSGKLQAESSAAGDGVASPATASNGRCTTGPTRIADITSCCVTTTSASANIIFGAAGTVSALCATAT
jgi:hypothetical protein